MKATTLFTSWENPQDVSRANLLFETRNKSYGGYFIRTHYPERIIRAFFLALLGFGMTTGALLITTRYVDVTTVVIPPNIPWRVDWPPDVPPTKTDIKPPPKHDKQKHTTQAGPPVALDSIIDSDNDKKQTASASKTGANAIGDSSSIESNGSDPPPPPPPPPKPEIVVEIMPEFPGGENALNKFLSDNIKYPVEARENKTEGRVYITFVVSETGKIRDARLIRGIGDGCDEEAIRVVKLMPDWKPGVQQGRKVPVQYVLPVKYTLR
jgi:periplasmic protein TonB